MNPLKIATDKSILPQTAELHWLLTPLFEPGLANEDSDKRYRRIYRSYYKISADLFDMVSLEEADLVIIPADWSWYQGSFSWLARPDRSAIYRAQKYAEMARRLGKPVVVFFSGERSHETVPLPGAWVFRKSMFRSQQRDRNVMVPEVFYLDLLKQLEIDQLPNRMWKPTPTVGFCGLAREKKLGDYFRQLGFHVFHYARERTFGVSQFRGVELRYEALRIMSESDKIDTNFIMRKESVFFDQKDVAKRQSVRQQFLENMLATDYQLSLRGSANYSRRPWEAMCIGRIPLFVDTDCVLPYKGEIDWSKLMVIVDEHDVLRLPDALIDFHSATDDALFLEIQRACRSTWEQYLTPRGLARWLHKFWANSLTS